MRTRFALAGTLALAACGGGGAGPAQPVTAVLQSIAADDGSVTDIGLISTGGSVAVGDNSVNTPWRAILRFDISGIPTGATIAAATLRTYQYQTEGSPFSTMGNVTVQHMALGTDPLTGAHFMVPPLGAVPGTLSTDLGLGPRSIDVTANVQADLAARRTRSDYRLQFEGATTDGDGADDLVLLSSGDYDGGVGQFARLEVVYTP